MMNHVIAILPSISTSLLSLAMFGGITFIYSFGDALMSYLAPNIIQSFVQDELVMGVIFSTSSVVGYLADVIIGTVFKEKSFYTYLFLGILTACLFPLVLLLPPSVGLFMLGMALWGIYYEFLVFSKYNFIHRCLSHQHHDTGWVVLNAFSNVAYLVAPVVAVSLTSFFAGASLGLAFALQMIALVSTLVYRFIFSRQIQHSNRTDSLPRKLSNISLWVIFNKKLWPILIFMFCLTLIDATFWTTGALLVDEKHADYPLASFFFAAYLLPTLVVTPIGVKISRVIGKKRVSFISGIITGLIFGITWLVQDFNVFMYIIAAGSIVLAIASPEINGAIEDYCERIGEASNSLVGLVGSMGSLGYIIGPILAGFLSVHLGGQKVFAVMGMLLGIVSVLALLIVPRKVHMPQKAIHTLTAAD